MHIRRTSTIPLDVFENGTKPFDIDFVGTGTYQISQFNLLQKRSIEFKKSSQQAVLSARGLHHRSKQHFSREVQDASAIIRQTLRKGASNPKSDEKSLPYLVSSYFQRAVCFERLGQLGKAIDDFTVCTQIDPTCASAYFNRAGLLSTQGKVDEAISDLNKAVSLEPSNLAFRNNRALMQRRKGNYLEAIKDTMIGRAVQIDPGIGRELIAGHQLDLDNTDLLMNSLQFEDPIISLLKKPKGERKGPQLLKTVDYLRNLQCFSMVSDDRAVLQRVVEQLSMASYRKGESIAASGGLDSYLFIVLEGEMAVVNCRETTDPISGLGSEELSGGGSSSPIREKIPAGKTFCIKDWSAVSVDGSYRFCGAMASLQPTVILTLPIHEYLRVIDNYNMALRTEVLAVLGNCAVFSDWDSPRLKRLATMVTLKAFAANEDILHAGDYVGCMYIVRKGVVRLMKAIDKPDTSNIQVSEFARPDSTVGMESPGLWVLEKNWKDSIETFDQVRGAGKIDFTVGVLGSSEVFGELSVLDPEQTSPYSVIAFTNVEIYCFESDDLIQMGARFNSATMNALDELMNLHNPPGDKIAYYFRSKFAWEKRKERILEDISRERQKLNNNKGTLVKLPKLSPHRRNDY
eukprot:gene11155-23316_t